MNEPLRIELDRSDRTYRSGDPVRGHVVLETDRGEACRSVYLLRYWRTHGKGRADTGDRKLMRIHEGPLEGAPPHRLPFEFDAPGGPFTYHGSLLNVDHYLEVQADLPELYEPGRPEQFVLVPGAVVDPPHPDLLKVTGRRVSSARGCRVVVGAILIFLGLFSLPFGLVFLIPGLFLAVPGLNRWLAGARVGEVTSATPDLIVEPGKTVRVRVTLHPKKARTINAATAVLRGREIVISGKGDDRRVEMHEIHSRSVTMSGPRELAPGRQATLEAEIEIPDRPAYTFTSKNNEVTWDVQVSVDIPTWPDWHNEHKVVVWASRPGKRRAEEVREAAPVGALPGPRAPPPRAAEGAAAAMGSKDGMGGKPGAKGRDAASPKEARTASAVSPSSAEAEPASGAGSSPLMSAVRAILERKSFGGGRDPLVRELVGRRFTFDLEVDLVRHTFGAGPDPAYRHGRTVTGRLPGSDIPVAVRFPAERNDEIDRFRRGDMRAVTATVVDWEKLSERPVLDA